MSQLKAPFAYRNFRVLFWAELIQRSGSYVAFTAISLTLSKQVGENPMLFGLLGAMITAPSLVLAPLAGTWIKSEQRQVALRFVQLWFALANSVCAALMAYGYQGNMGLLGAALMFGMGLATAGPTLSAFLRDIIVDDKHLASANSVSWATLNLVVLVGSLVGGVLISFLGPSACFTCAALANLCAFAILYQLQPNKAGNSQKIPLPPLLKGDKSLSRLSWMRGPLMIVLSFEVLNSFAASPHVFQLPPLNDHVLAGTPFTYGLLLAAGSAGGVSGGLLLGLLRLPLSKLMIYMSYCILCIGLCLISLSLSETLWISMLVLFLLNIATAFLMVCETTFIQTNTSESTRGQVMGFFMMAHIGLIPFGSVLLYGTVGDFVGSLRVFGVAGSLFICAFFLSRLTMLRQVESYENQGV